MSCPPCPATTRLSEPLQGAKPYRKCCPFFSYSYLNIYNHLVFVSPPTALLVTRLQLFSPLFLVGFFPSLSDIPVGFPNGWSAWGHRFGPWNRAGRQHIPHLSHCSGAGTAPGTAGRQSWHSTAQERARSRQGGEGAALHPCEGEQCAGQATAHSIPCRDIPREGSGGSSQSCFLCQHLLSLPVSSSQVTAGLSWLAGGEPQILIPRFSSHHPLSLPRGLTVTHKTPALLQWLRA